MDLPDAIDHCLTKPEATESTPFGPEAVVYKVHGKIFAIAVPDEVPPRLNLKCDPDRALALRDEFPAIVPGYHMNKKHWNTLVLDGSLPPTLVRELIDHSYTLVSPARPAKPRKKTD